MNTNQETHPDTFTVVTTEPTEAMAKAFNAICPVGEDFGDAWASACMESPKSTQFDQMVRERNRLLNILEAYDGTRARDQWDEANPPSRMWNERRISAVREIRSQLAAHSPASGVVEREALIAQHMLLVKAHAMRYDGRRKYTDQDELLSALKAVEDHFRAALSTQPLEQKPVAWMSPENTRDCITDAKKRDMETVNGQPGKTMAAKYVIPLYLGPQPEQVAQDSGPLTDRELAAIGRVINVAPLMIPKWSAVRIELEKDAGTVYWLDVKSGAWRHVDGGGEPFSEQISVAIGRAARASGQEGAK